MELTFDGGSSADPQDRAGLTSLMASLLDEGAGDRNALEVSDALRLLATDYHAGVDSDHVTLSMDLLSEQLTPSLDLLADFLMRPRFEKTDFERMRKQRVAAAMASSANPRSARNIVLKRVLFGKGYAGLPSAGFPGTLSEITLDEVKNAYRAQIKPQGATLIVVGSVKRDLLEKELNRALGSWEGSATVQMRELAVKAQSAAIHWVDFPGSTQSALALVRVTDGLSDHPNQIDDDLFNLVFGGKFTSRLNLNLREDKGYTYGAYSGLYRLRRAGFHFLSAMVKGDTTLASTQEMLKEIKLIRSDKPVEETELAAVKGGELQGFPARFEKRSKILSELSGLRAEGREPGWLDRWYRHVKDAQQAAIQEAALRVARPEAYHIVVAGDRAAHLDSFKSLGLPISLYNAEGELLEQIDPVVSEVKEDRRPETPKEVDVAPKVEEKGSR